VLRKQGDFVLGSRFKRKNGDRIYRMNMIFQKKRKRYRLHPLKLAEKVTIHHPTDH